MPRGGARVNSGPPPDPDALRRDRPEDKAGWTLLPAEGFRGPVPEWPLPADLRLTTMLELVEHQREILEAQIDAGTATRGAPAKLAKLDQQAAELTKRLAAAGDMELKLWESVWQTPQATAWDRLRWVREVALYVRLQVQAELGDLDAGKEARQWSDRLGLNPAALLRTRWKIVGEGESEKPAARPRTASRTRSGSKARLGVIDGGKSS